jgi:hypothetical protein
LAAAASSITAAPPSIGRVTSYINGVATAPIIGEHLRIICTPESLPPGPYSVFVTYYLV